MSKIRLFDINIDNVSMDQAVNRIDGFISDKSGLKTVFTPNVDHLMMLRKDREFKDIYNKADFVIADGMPVVWASHILKKGLKEKVSGIDLVYKLYSLSENKGHSVYFLGAREDVMKDAVKKIKKQFPNLKITGFHSPSFNITKEENKEMISKINSAKPDMLFVGFGAPKQEIWLYNNKEKLKAKVGIGVGGSFVMISGRFKRAPKFMQKAGLEWLYRLIQDPKRLWKRYLRDIKFPFLVALELAKNKR